MRQRICQRRGTSAAKVGYRKMDLTLVYGVRHGGRERLRSRHGLLFVDEGWRMYIIELSDHSEVVVASRWSENRRRVNVG